MTQTDVSTSLKSVYDAQYQTSDARWREIGARQKADDIVQLCQKYGFKKMLDVGSGDGAVLRELDQRKFIDEMYSVEISNSGIEKIKARNLQSLKEITLFDGYTIPHADKAFELSTCSHVVEHVEHPRILLREIARVSEYQFFEIPIDFSFFVDKKIKHFLDYGHINIYTPALFKFLLKSEGFEVLDEAFMFLTDEVIEFMMKSSKEKAIYRFKTFFLKNIPALRQIKPNAYAVLCKHSGQQVTIF